MSLFDIILIVITTFICVLAFSKRMQEMSKENAVLATIEQGIQGLVTRYYWWLVACVVIIAVGVRIWKFGDIPHGFNQDEAMAALEAFSLAEHGTDHYGMSFPVYFTAWITSQMNVLLSYVLIPFFKLFGPSVLVVRLPLLLFSLVSLYIAFRFSYKLFGKNAALAILFIIAINPWQIMMSRWALEANLFPHFLLYGSYLLYLGFEKKRYVYLSMIVFGIAMYSYGIAYYLVPLLLLIVCVYMIWTKSIKLYEVLICIVLYAVVAWPIFAMMAVNFFELNTIELPFMTIPYFEQGERMNDVLFFSDNIRQQIVTNVLCLVCIVFFQVEDSLWNSIPEIGPLYFIAIPLFFFGIALFIDEYRNKNSKCREGVFVLLALFVSSMFSGIITNNVNLNRINAIMFPMLFMIGYAIYHICKRLKMATIPLLLMFALLFGSFSYAYFTGDYSIRLGYEFYYGFSDAANYIKDMEYEKLYVTSKTQGDNASFTSEIMLQFLLELDTKYIIGEYLPEDEILEYKEKYNYEIAEEVIDVENPSVVYIAHVQELQYFDEECFDFIIFGNYSVVVHKNYKDVNNTQE